MQVSTEEDAVNSVDTPIAPASIAKNQLSQKLTETPAFVGNNDIGTKVTAGRWSQEEDDRLKEVVKEHGPKNWKLISQIAFNGSRSDVQCLHRWQKVLRPGLVKGPWTNEEDEVIVNLISTYGIGNIKWSEIAANLPGRLGKQCRERWVNHLDPNLKKDPWSDEEDRILMEQQILLGNKWRDIAAHLPGRSENSVKNRWNSARRKRKRSEAAAVNGGSKSKKKTIKSAEKKAKDDTKAKEKAKAKATATATAPSDLSSTSNKKTVPAKPKDVSKSNPKSVKKGSDPTSKKSIDGSAKKKEKCANVSKKIKPKVKKPKEPKKTGSKKAKAEKGETKQSVESQPILDVLNMPLLDDELSPSPLDWSFPLQASSIPLISGTSVSMNDLCRLTSVSPIMGLGGDFGLYGNSMSLHSFDTSTNSQRILVSPPPFQENNSLGKAGFDTPLEVIGHSIPTKPFLKTSTKVGHQTESLEVFGMNEDFEMFTFDDLISLN